MKTTRPNLCTVTVTVHSEACSGDKATVQLDCVKDGLLVRACRYFSPMKLDDGKEVYWECQHFDGSCADGCCTCVEAREASRLRAAKILAAYIVR